MANNVKAMVALYRGLMVYKPPPKLSLIGWSDRYRRVAAKTSASPGHWRTSSQPVCFGPMAAVLDPGTHTVSIMAGTQILKTEFLLNVACYYIHQDPSPILFVQPTQGAATSFSKERFAPTVEATPALRSAIEPPKYRDSENTITHKDYAGGSIDFVGANSPVDLSSRPKRIILCDEIDKYPISAGAEGDPLKLAEERASTYHTVGRAKFVRTCSPTVKDFSRIEREYLASDQRRCYLTCPYCYHEQTLTWQNVRWDQDKAGNYLPDTAAISCAECGVVWSESDRIAALDALETAPGHGWRETKPFLCCEETHAPSLWDDRGRSLCPVCQQPSPYAGHAGFHVSKLYSKRHRLPEIVTEFLEAKNDAELLKKFTNSALAELWAPKYSATFNSHALLARAELYSGADLPEAVKIITGFCDTQIDRLEIQLIGWGEQEEAWPFQYTIIHQDPAQPQAWRELDAILQTRFTTVTGRPLRVAAFGVDWGGSHGDQVLSYCRARRGRRIFACKGFSGSKPIWPGRGSKAKSGDVFFAVGVDTAKAAIYAKLRIDAPEPGVAKPGFIHFPTAENFNSEYFEQLNSERQEVRVRFGQRYLAWVQIRERNEALDTFVGCLAMRKSLPRNIARGLEYSVQGPAQQNPVQRGEPETGSAPPAPSQAPPQPRQPQPEAGQHQAYHEVFQAANRPPSWIGQRRGWMNRGE
jgi:phage terminase large subunit GpA-like protein